MNQQLLIMNLIMQTFLLTFLFMTIPIHCQREYDYGSQRILYQREKLIWCVISPSEMKKCQDWSEAIRRSRSASFEFDLECKRAQDKDQCMNLIENLQAHLVTLDPGEVFVAGRYHSLIPIMSEQYNAQRENGYYSVAVVKTESASLLRDLRDLREKKVCFTGVGHMASWVLPMARLLDEDNPPLLHIRDCNNMIKSAADFFGPSCAPNSLIDKYNPTGDNPQSMCSLCSSRLLGKSQSCSGSDHYANFEGAFQCLTEVGDVAFLKHTTVDQMTRRRIHGAFSKNNFELLCPYGGRRSIDSYSDCNWGYVPSHSVVISSATLPDKRLQIQRFLQESANRFGVESWQDNFYPRTTSRPGRFNQSTRFGNQFTQQPRYTTSVANTTVAFSLLGDS